MHILKNKNVRIKIDRDWGELMLKKYLSIRITLQSFYTDSSKSKQTLIFFFGTFEVRITFGNNEGRNLWSLHTNWWSRNLMQVLRWCTVTIAAVILNTLCQHRTNAYIERKSSSNEDIPWLQRRLKTFEYLHYTTVVLYLSGLTKIKTEFLFFGTLEEKNHLCWK